MKWKQKITEFFFNQYLEILSNSRTFARGKHSAWTPTAKNGAAVPHRLSLPAKTIGQKPGGKAAPTFMKRRIRWGETKQKD